MSRERYVDAEKYDDHPERIVFEGAVYFVGTDRDSEGEIQYVQLIDVNNELFFEMDWVGEIDSSTILKYLEEEKYSGLIDENVEAENEDVGRVPDSVGDAERVSRFVRDFDFLFCEYSSYPVEFKVEMMEKLEKHYSDESFQFQRILVSEAAEDWDDEE